MPYILSKNLCREKWGTLPYQIAWDRQSQYVEEIIAGERPETLVLCSHPPVVTLGRGTQKGDVTSWDGDTLEVNRGGRATFHGPSQIVFYPLVNLNGGLSKTLPMRDLHGFMRLLENVIIAVLETYGIHAQGSSIQKTFEGDLVDATGVWVESRKIASIGIAAKKWISSHGLALNVFRNKDAHVGIKPCGFTTETMVCLEELTEKNIERSSLEDQIITHFSSMCFR